jgi:tetratricopeptide (TPR) repeat protein
MVFALVLLGLAPITQNQHLLGAEEVLKRIAASRKSEQRPLGSDNEYPANYRKQLDLKKRIGLFYTRMPKLDSKEAGSEWLKLFDDSITFGVETDSVVSVLPPPESWSVIQTGIEGRMANRKSVRASAFRLFASLLGENRGEQEAKLRDCWALSATLPATGNRSPIEGLYEVGAKLALQTRNVKLLKDSLNGAAQGSGQLYIQDAMLDFLGSEKEAFLKLLLSSAKCPLAYSSYYSDTPNGKLIYKLAIETVASHKAPQWMLAERMDNIELFEAIAKRFNPFKPWPLTAPKKADEFPDRLGEDKRGRLARTYYLLSLAKSGQIEKALKGAGDGNTLVNDYSLQQPQAPKVNEFLRQLLIAHPKLGWWDNYQESAIALGRYQEILETTSAVLSRPGIADKDKAPVLKCRESALLAVDKLDEAFSTMGRRAAIEGKDMNSMSSEEAIYRMERLAKVLNNKALDKLVASVRASKKYAGQMFGNVEKPLVKREAEVAQSERYSHRPDESAGSELIAIYSAANRPSDVIKIAEAEGLWVESDIREVDASSARYYGRTSQLASISLATALNKVGRHGEAYAIAKDFVSRNLGDDAGYELLVSCNSKDILTDLDSFAALNPYEERPLIWKAKVLLDQGKTDEAEQAIKAAIAIDPSDGEQPHGRRMFGYAVFADILDKKGEPTQSRVYRGVVRAIRIAEKADDYLQMGMIKRAIATYNSALSEFSDAYCIQSRLAINLAQAGRMNEAISHYRKAYELMADSFGYVETHCFGCEEAFTGETQQNLAEEVFTKIAEERPNKPQIHYLLGYLREVQNRTQEAIAHYKHAIELDGRFLNAWKRLGQVGEKVLSADEISAIDTKIAQLEPKVAADPRISGWHDMSDLTFPAAFRKTALQLQGSEIPLFKLKAMPLSAADPFGDSGERFGRGIGGERKTPGQGLMQTAIYRELSYSLNR